MDTKGIVAWTLFGATILLYGASIYVWVSSGLSKSLAHGIISVFR